MKSNLSQTPPQSGELTVNRTTPFRRSRGLLLAGMLVVTLASPTLASAQQPHNDSGFSLGLILGDPSGLTLRGGIGGKHAIQAHFGFSPVPGDALVAMVDWTYDAWDFLPHNNTIGLKFYFGFGGKGQWFTGRYFIYKHSKHDNHFHHDDSHYGLGIRGLVGLRAPFRKAPFDLFLEIAPAGVMFVFPDAAAYFDFDAAIGFRYRF